MDNQTPITTNPNPNDELPLNIEEILHNAYLQYSLSVNVGRAIPDVRDGLKPGMRRVLYAMKMLGLTKSHSYVKCARVVGEVIAKYHPHGDSSVYDTMVRMAQDFSMRYMLIDGQGNFGSIDGDSPAAYRYTECRMQKIAEEMLADLDKETVDMQPNFDEKETEPMVLPARIPNLLLNGTTGIGVGMATSIPPHNLGELIDACILILDNPAVTVDDIMEVLPGPDFPTGATITGIKNIRTLYETGRSSVYLKGKADIYEKNGIETIIVTEIPYAVNKENLVKKIADLVKNGVITGIAGLNDESSSRAGIRIVVTIKRNAMANIVLNQLFKHTPLATGIGCQFLVVHKNQPRTMSLKQLLQAYLDHRLEVITRKIKYLLRKAEARAHIVEGLLIAVNNIDEVIKMIQKSKTKEEAAAALMGRFELTKRQTNAILEMRLHQLTGLAIDALQTEYDELMKKINHYKELLASRALLLGLVKDDLIDVKEKYADPRRSNIVAGGKDINMEDLIPRHIVTITVSNEGYIKRVPIDTYRTQHRGGVGVKSMETKEEDFVKHLFTACTHDYILIFTNHGRMHWLKAYTIPEASRTSKGKAMINLLEFDKGESVRSMITVSELDVDDQYLIMATKKGTVKKSLLNVFKNLRKKPIKAIVLDEGDDLMEVRLTDGTQEILLSTYRGMACRFKETDARMMGRVTRGVRGIRLNEEDHVIDMSVVNDEMDIMVVTKKGMGKRTNVSEYRLTKRGGKGVRNIKLKEKDVVVASLKIEENSEIMMTTKQGQLVRIATDPIRAIGRSSQGVKIMNLKDRDQIISVSIVMEMKEEEKTDSEEGEQEIISGAGVETGAEKAAKKLEEEMADAGAEDETANTENDESETDADSEEE